jgi:iron complex transport system substrate-binding protein
MWRSVIVPFVLAGACLGATCASRAASAPARIVSLSPHITELLFAVGAGDRIVGVDSYSDYPPPAKRIPRVADVFAIDVERLLTVRPDLVIYWTSGTPIRQQDQLKSMGFRLYGTEQRRLADISAALVDFGRLAGTETQGRQAAAQFDAGLRALRVRYRNRPTLSVFYQVWDRPMYTLTGAHVVSEALALCGARNVFADLKGLAPVVETEAVLARDPDVVIVAAIGDEGRRLARVWESFAGLKAARRQHVYLVEPDLLNRMSPRILQGIDGLCRTLDQARLRAPPAAAALRDDERSSVARR